MENPMENTIQLIQGDITRIPAEAIVNAANCSLLGGGGIDGAIHEAAGPELWKECLALGGCQTGMAKITRGYRLPAKYVIHAVGPVWYGGKEGEKELLTSCYKSSMEIAIERGIKSIAFPLISSGICGYPKKEALIVAISTLKTYLSSGIKITLVLYDMDTFMLAYKVNRALGQ